MSLFISHIFNVSVRAIMLATFFFLPVSQAQRPQEVVTLSLKQAIEIALQQHPDLLSSELRAAAQKEDITQAESAYFPRLSGDVVTAYSGRQVTRADADSAFGITDALILRRLSCGLILKQLILDFGRTSNLISASHSAAEAKVAKFFSTRDQIIFNVVRAYYTYLRAEQILEIATKTPQFGDLAAQAGLHHKDTTNADHLIFKQTVHEGHLLALKAQQELEDSRAELCLALGYEDLKEFVLTEPISPAPYSHPLEPLIEIGKKLNPELASLRAELSEKKFQHDSVQADHYPTLNATGYAGVNPWRQDFLTSNYAAAGINLNIPIFAGGRVSAEARKRLCEIKALEKELIAKEHRLVKDIRLAWNTVQTSYQHIGILEEIFITHSSALDAAHKAYKNKKIPLLQLIEAHLRKLQAEISFVSSKHTHLINCALINLLLGSKNKYASKDSEKPS